MSVSYLLEKASRFFPLNLLFKQQYAYTNVFIKIFTVIIYNFSTACSTEKEVEMMHQSPGVKVVGRRSVVRDDGKQNYATQLLKEVTVFKEVVLIRLSMRAEGMLLQNVMKQHIVLALLKEYFLHFQEYNPLKRWHRVQHCLKNLKYLFSCGAVTVVAFKKCYIESRTRIIRVSLQRPIIARIGQLYC